MRLFVALTIPDSVAASLMLIQGGVPGARWQSREQLHLTLSFIGEVDGRDAAMIDDALAGIRAPGFTLQLHGVGQFGTGKLTQAHALWAGLRPHPALEHLQRKVDTAIRRVGTPREAHKFTPHVTLARLHDASSQDVADYLSVRGYFPSRTFLASRFVLFSSRASTGGGPYVVEDSYALSA